MTGVEREQQADDDGNHIGSDGNRKKVIISVPLSDINCVSISTID